MSRTLLPLQFWVKEQGVVDNMLLDGRKQILEHGAGKEPRASGRAPKM